MKEYNYLSAYRTNLRDRGAALWTCLSKRERSISVSNKGSMQDYLRVAHLRRLLEDIWEHTYNQVISEGSFRQNTLTRRKKL